jgi:hypothetical protein
LSRFADRDTELVLGLVTSKGRTGQAHEVFPTCAPDEQVNCRGRGRRRAIPESGTPSAIRRASVEAGRALSPELSPLFPQGPAAAWPCLPSPVALRVPFHHADAAADLATRCAGSALAPHRSLH